MNHLALAVHDQDRSRLFYERYLGFGAAPARRYPDGTLMLYDERGFALALGLVEGDIRLPAFLHFGKDARSPDEVRSLCDLLRADGIQVVGVWEEQDYVSVKFSDPDGYVVEVAWEP